MIRINLLPQKRRAEKTAETSQLWLVVLLLLFLGEVAGLLVYHGMKSDDLKDQQDANKVLEGQISEAKKAVTNHPQIKDQLAQLRAREDAIAKLQNARSGPTAVMLELARILTPGRGPSVDPDRLAQIRRENPLAVYNPGWDARRLWLTKFVEQQRKVKLEGIARDGEDVSELARRMNLSTYFHDVRLLPGKKEKLAGADAVEVIKFQLEAQVRY
jgi:type IV pilus assembly protein PilN